MFLLEATTPRSRDQYAHTGFQMRALDGQIPVRKGYANVNDYKASGMDAALACTPW